MGKGKLLQQRRVDNEEKIMLLQEAIAGKTSLECLLEGDKKWSELTEYQQGRLFRQASAVLFYELKTKLVEQRKMREMLAIMNAHMNDNTNPPARSNCVSSFSDLLPLFDIVADAVDECD